MLRLAAPYQGEDLPLAGRDDNSPPSVTPPLAPSTNGPAGPHRDRGPAGFPYDGPFPQSRARTHLIRGKGGRTPRLPCGVAESGWRDCPLWLAADPFRHRAPGSLRQTAAQRQPLGPNLRSSSKNSSQPSTSKASSRPSSRAGRIARSKDRHMTAPLSAVPTHLVVDSHDFNLVDGTRFSITLGARSHGPIGGPTVSTD